MQNLEKQRKLQSGDDIKKKRKSMRKETEYLKEKKKHIALKMIF